MLGLSNFAINNFIVKKRKQKDKPPIKKVMEEKEIYEKKKHK